jgi:5-methylcytosine-specific restriction protein B
MAATWIEAMGEAQQAGLRILLAHPEGLPARELWPMVVETLPAIEAETRAVTTGSTTPESAFKWQSIGLVKAGWLTKSGGRWYATPVGRWALGQYPEPSAFFRATAEPYTYWERRKAQFELARRLVEAVEEGSWVSVDDLAAQCELDPKRLVVWLQGDRPEGWHRVLDAEGRIPDAVFADAATRDRWHRMLHDDGIAVIMDAAPAERRVDRPELRQLVADEPDLDGVPEERLRRVWLVRGTSARGFNLVRDWLNDDYCSLPASRLRELPAGASRDEVRKAVEEDYYSATYGERTRRATEFYAFLTQMRVGDLVLTVDGTDAYLGEITSDATFTASEESRANLQRRVKWQRRDRPYDFNEQLPDALAAKISSQHDVLDLSEFLTELEELYGGHAVEDTKVVLPEPTVELAGKLFVGLDWLRECVELLRDRPQLIFYGPPGTGKTYLAQEIALHLAGGRPQNVKLVQFHPAYSYEDFFQGYRPVESDGGMGVTFTLKDGPLRRMVDAARKNKDQPHVLIIDEINRGNLAKIFGELYFLLEYRAKAVELMYASEADLDDQTFTMPENLFIIGTMNTADRSIALVDAAMRRRFSFVELHPSQPPTSEVLAKWLERRQLPGEAARLLDALNARIDDRDFKIGPSYLMRERIYQNPAGLDLVWKTQILPLLEEHHYGDGVDVEARYGLDALRRTFE